MKVYVRKIDNQCVEKQISVLRSIVNDFFGNNLIIEENANVPGGKVIKFMAVDLVTKKEGYIRILPQTDPRFSSSDIKSVLSENYEIGDILIFYENNRKYELELIKPRDSKYKIISELCERDERHTLLEFDSTNFNSSNNKEKFKNWLFAKKYSDSSSIQYTNHVNLASKEALEKGVIQVNLYDISDMNELKTAIDSIKQMNEYIIRKNNGNGINEAALNLYLNFAKENFNNSIMEDNISILDKYEAFYINNIDEFKNIQELAEGIELRKQFVEEYPLERIKDLSLDEYVLGTGNNESLSYQIEFGKYKHAGLGIGGGSSGKHGIYFGKEDRQYHGYKEKVIENPNEYWNQFKNQLYNCLKEIGETNKFPNLREKYSLLETIPIVLAKLCFMYYPNLFINIGSRGRLQSIIDLFDINVSDEKISALMSFEISKYLKNNLDVINNNDSQWIGHTLWRFICAVEESKDSDDTIIKENNEFEEYNKDKFLEDVFINEDKYNSIISILEKKKNIILEGAPGVGKTFMAKRLAYSIIGKKDQNKVKLIQFHQSYSYEDFVEGYRPMENGFKLEQGIFYKLCKKAEANPTENYYLIIDEINRGNLSKIFGELLMLIESDKRGEHLTLAYSEENFSVPENLYIIGLMNTADRSLALIDYALRRRFSFIRIEPAFESEKFIKSFNEKFDNNFNNVIEIIKKINEAIEQDKSLGAGFKIGHSYFCPNLKDRKGNKKDIEDIIIYEILPLLEEYWYDDPDSIIQWKDALSGVLND